MKRLLLIFMLLPMVCNGATWYYSTAGDNSDGTSWATAWTTSLDSINAHMSAGDTCLFGFGTYRGKLLVVGGTGADRSCYACSSSVDTGVYLQNSTHLSADWSQISTSNRYSHTFSNLDSLHDPGVGMEDSEVGAVFQGDSILTRVNDSATMTAGTWYGNATHVIVYLTDLGSGYDPTSYTVDVAMPFGSYGDDDSHVTFRGLVFQKDDMANSRWHGACDSVFFRNCQFRYVGGWVGKNPSNLYTSTIEAQSDYWRIVGCTFNGVKSWYNYAVDSSHGANITFYSWSNSIIDSCTFTGPAPHTRIWFKNDNTYEMDNDTVRFCTFEASAAGDMWFARHLRWIYVYGNVFIGCTSASGTITVCNSDEAGNGQLHFTNNTFSGCDIPFAREACGNSYLLNDTNTIKYCVFEETGAMTMKFIDSAFQPAAIDSNLYDTATSITFVLDSTNRTAPQWVGYGFDANSAFGLDAGLDANYERLSCDTAEMSQTYGGVTWTRYGAKQATSGSAGGGKVKNSVILRNGVR